MKKTFSILSVGMAAMTGFAQENSHPNVLMICIDDLNDWLGCMNGHPNTKTPNIDRLAAEGVLFTNAHCQAPLSGPSRASVMTGLRPSTTGIYGMIDDNKINKDNAITEDIIFLPQYFKDNGYHTIGIGKIFHEHAPDGVFDESGGRVPGFGPVPPKRFVWSGKPGKKGYGSTGTDWGAFPEVDSLMPDYKSAQWTIERLNRNYDKPFFLAVGFLRPHVPLYVPQKWFDLHPLENIVTPSYLADDLDDVPNIALQINDLPMMPTTQWAIESGEWPKIVQAYLACVSFVDFYVGQILDALKNSKYADNTVVVLWSDHGYRLGEKGTFAKHCLWEEATKAPLIFSGPGIIKGKKVNYPTEMLSIYPTLLNLCGLNPYDRNEGIDLTPILHGGKVKKKKYALTTYGWGNHAIRSRNYRYIRYNDGSEEFYDHRSDPHEWYNLVNTKKARNEIEKLIKFIPQYNAPYAEYSFYNYNPYFINDKLNHSK
jgi:iduronate 2-sulfatase